jgi:hypothetical protein
MLADVHCPKRNKIRPMKDCIACKNHINNGTSLEWCGYRKSETRQDTTARPETIPLNALEMQMRKKLGKADYFYKTGKTRIADNLSYEAAQIETQIRRIRKDA